MTAPRTPAAIFDLTGQVALVTGASEGLGWAMAQTLAAAGAYVVITGRRLPLLQAKLEQLQAWGMSGEAMAFDAADAGATKAAIAALASRHGRLDIVVSNTAAGVRKAFLEMDEAEWQSVIDGSLTAGWRLARETAPIMAGAGYGRIILISSINATLARPGISAYVTAKTALHGLVRALAVELAPVGVTVNALAPGYFLTNGNVALRTAKPDFHDKIAARTPAARWGDPQELGAAALYLASRASSFTTGSVITVDGGLTATI
ncbi:MAG: hypothetical protein JWP99_1372 [Devosia sp.]|nr:hypothetical protein [Devosia sp.]